MNTLGLRCLSLAPLPVTSRSTGILCWMGASTNLTKPRSPRVSSWLEENPTKQIDHVVSHVFEHRIWFIILAGMSIIVIMSLLILVLSIESCIILYYIVFIYECSLHFAENLQGGHTDRTRSFTPVLFAQPRPTVLLWLLVDAHAQELLNGIVSTSVVVWKSQKKSVAPWLLPWLLPWP